MALFGGSKTNVTNQYDTYNLGVEDSEGAILNVGGTVVATDGGLLEAVRELAGQVVPVGERSIDVGRDLALEAMATGERNLDVVADLTRDVVDVGARQNDLVATVLSDAAREQFHASESMTRDVLGFAGDASARAFDFATSSSRDALDQAGVTTAHALDVVDLNTGRAIDATLELGRDFLSESGALVDRVLTQTNNSGAAFLSAVENFQARESNNADARLQDISRTVAVGFFILAGLGIAAYAWTRG